MESHGKVCSNSIPPCQQGKITHPTSQPLICIYTLAIPDLASTYTYSISILVILASCLLSDICCPLAFRYLFLLIGLLSQAKRGNSSIHNLCIIQVLYLLGLTYPVQ